MSAPANSKTASTNPSGSSEKGGFYLQPRTKIWILGICLVMMIGASVYAVLQPLNPDPLDATLVGRLWYPHETNPYARLQAVRCANDYACRLNSVAVNGTGDLPEVWAVGNVGLVLHRKAGQSKWEQLTISATEEKESGASAKPAPTPKSAPTPGKSPNPVPSATPTPTPTPVVPVPYLIGLSLVDARGFAEGSGFRLEVEYEKGSEPDPKAQGAPPELRVVAQSPVAKSLVPANSIIKVTLARAPRSKASLLLNALVPSVYAEELEKQDRQAQQPNSSSAGSGQAPLPAGQASTLDDDLIKVDCNQLGCDAIGRSGRIWIIKDAQNWRSGSIFFTDVNGNPIEALVLLSALNSDAMVAKSGSRLFVCRHFVQGRYICTPLLTGGSATVENQFKGTSNPRIQFDNVILEIGDSGSIIRSVSGSPTATAVRSDTKAALQGGVASSKRTFIVGDHGIILSSTDGGNTWRHETQGPEGAAPNHRLPALWYWIAAGLLILTCSVVLTVPPPPPVTEFSVADWTVTDAPLKPGDVDSLGFTPMSLGLSRFIRNPKTQPPVTVAIEGEWGEGKSSVMSLLRGDLEKSRFRPVWFNAWHHQSEEQLLAALLQHIKNQAVPPWWHIDNWIFRARLIHFRFREKWPLLVLLVLGLCGTVAFELTRHGLKLADFVNFGTDLITLIKYLLPWSGQKDLPQDLGHFSVVATVIAIFAAVFRKAKAFGINPAKLTDNLRDAAAIKDVKPDPGVRPRFAREFGDVCRAWSWGGRRVIIFIDDLDRCRPESVVTVLESINFLTTAGDCMIVLGMAQNQVTHCVGLGFKDIAHAEAAYHGGGNTEQEKAIARFNYGAFYIKKLVNIVAPLPKTTPEQRRRVLEVRAAEVRRQAEEAGKKAAPWRTTLWNGVSQGGRMVWKIVPVLALLLAVALSVSIGYREGNLQKGPEKPGQTSSNPAPPPPAPTPQSTPGRVTGRAQPLVYDRPTSQPGILVEPDNSTRGVWWSYAVDALFLLLLFGILAYQLSARTNQDAQNSPEFEDSLKLWGQYIVGVCDTPREIKRALNDLRYQAMTQRSNGPSITRGERLARAMRQFVTGRAEAAPLETRVDEAALPPRKAAELASLTDDELKAFLDPDKLDMKGSENLQRLMELKREHLRHFHRWIGEVAPATALVAQGLEDAPPARAAHQA
ncbi:MAG TPA: P-loop NTPase fold protein [Candidatus Angelobacter sp.]